MRRAITALIAASLLSPACALKREPADLNARAEASRAAAPVADDAWAPIQAPRLTGAELEQIAEMAHLTAIPDGTGVRSFQWVNDARLAGSGLVRCARFRPVDQAGAPVASGFTIEHLAWFGGATPDCTSLQALRDSARNNLFWQVDVPANRTPRGLVVTVPSISGDRERAFRAQMLERGWGVLTLNGFHLSTREHGGPLPKPTSEMTTEERLANCVAEVRFGQSAFALALQDVLAYLDAHAPEIPTEPLALAGFSLGALQAPTIAARNAHRVDAIVLYGGGADMMGILSSTPALRPMSDFSFDFTREEREQLAERYRARAPLDPYNTARTIAGIPTLVVHARHDAVIPARYGRLVWERLGRPDRWTFPGGHLGLFFMMPHYADDIADWIEATLDAAGSDQPPPTP